MIKKQIIFLLSLLFVSQACYAMNEFDYSSKEFQEITSQLYMQGHSDHDISTCATKATYYKEIAEMMQQGKTEEQIIGYYVNQYGESALKAPAKKGFSLMAWIIPFLVLLIASVAIFFLVRSLVLKNKSQQSTISKQVTQIEESTRSKIDKERKKYL